MRQMGDPGPPPGPAAGPSAGRGGVMDPQEALDALEAEMGLVFDPPRALPVDHAGLAAALEGLGCERGAAPPPRLPSICVHRSPLPAPFRPGPPPTHPRRPQDRFSLAHAVLATVGAVPGYVPSGEPFTPAPASAFLGPGALSWLASLPQGTRAALAGACASDPSVIEDAAGVPLGLLRLVDRPDHAQALPAWLSLLGEPGRSTLLLWAPARRPPLDLVLAANPRRASAARNLEDLREVLQAGGGCPGGLPPRRTRQGSGADGEPRGAGLRPQRASARGMSAMLRQSGLVGGRPPSAQESGPRRPKGEGSEGRSSETGTVPGGRGSALEAAPGAGSGPGQPLRGEGRLVRHSADAGLARLKRNSEGHVKAGHASSGRSGDFDRDRTSGLLLLLDAVEISSHDDEAGQADDDATMGLEPAATGDPGTPKRRRRWRQELLGPCAHCGTRESPQWRRGPPCKPVLCNACGTRWLRFGTVERIARGSIAVPGAAGAKHRCGQCGSPQCTGVAQVGGRGTRMPGSPRVAGVSRAADARAAAPALSALSPVARRRRWPPAAAAWPHGRRPPRGRGPRGCRRGPRRRRARRGRRRCPAPAPGAPRPPRWARRRGRARFSRARGCQRCCRRRGRSPSSRAPFPGPPASAPSPACPPAA